MSTDKILLALKLAVFFVICVLTRFLLSGHPELFFILAMICCALSGYSVALYLQRVKKNVCANKIIYAVSRLADSPDAIPLEGDKDLEAIYKEIRRQAADIHKKELNRAEILNIVTSVSANIEFEKFLEVLIPKLINATNSNCGAFYLLNTATDKLEIKYSQGFSKNVFKEFDMAIGEGFVGMAALSREIHVYRNIPDDTIYVLRTTLGKIKPKNLMAIPVVNIDQLVGVMVFASIYNYTEDELEMLNTIKYYIGVAVGNGLVFEKTKRLTNELRFQNKLIQNLNDDLEARVRERTWFLHDVLDSIEDYAIYAVDKECNVVIWNKGAERIFGYSANEMLSQHIRGIYSEQEPNIINSIIEMHIEKITALNKYTERAWRVNRNGKAFYAEMTWYQRHDEKGQIVGYTNITRDITEKVTTDKLPLGRQ
ncbi:MAG: PAS domain S-box protein [Clostridiales bacterium]|jgi:PAS domain S-box-containing protein|nr:PAS domain S-box protein [Clostridiales bacterium]